MLRPIAIFCAPYAFALTIFLGGEPLAFAHARLKPTGTPKPRSSGDGLKTAPCGGVARTTTSAKFAPGATITVEWEETINHPGRFIFSVAEANDQGFTDHVLATVEDTKNTTNDLPHTYSTTLTLPNVECEACTLQMIQVMTDRNPPTNYYSCADVQLTSDGDDTVETEPAPTTKPSAPTGLKVKLAN